jgi:hypothetical protein
MGARENFIQYVNGGSWDEAADLLNGSAMFDILPFLAALGSNCANAVSQIAGVLRRRGWTGSAQRIEWAGEVVRTRTIPPPPADLPGDQVADARRFLTPAGPRGTPQPFQIEMASPFRSGWSGGLGGPNSGGHHGSDWFIQFGMDLGVITGTDVRAAFTGHVTRFAPHRPSSDTAKVYGAQLFMRSDNNMMGGFYTHFTGGPNFSVGQRLTRGDRLGSTLRDHLHLAVVEIIGGAPAGRYKGVDLYRHFLALRDQSNTITVTFNQDGSPPGVT